MDSVRSITAQRDVALMKSLPGYRFSLTDEEIVDYVEQKRLDPDNFCVPMIQELDIYSYEPWDLAGTHSEVYIFSKPLPKNKNSVHRKTGEGCWKSNGKGSQVNRIGRKRTLSFVRGNKSTEWAMHEFYIFKEDSRYKKDFVLCVVKKKKGWYKKRGVSTTNEGQSNQQSVPCSGQPLPEDTISKTVPVQQPSNDLVSNRSQTTENIFLKTQLPLSDPAMSYYRNEGEENNILYSQQLSTDTMISSSRNVGGNDFPESQQQLPYHDMIPYDRNHVANGYPESQQQQPKQGMIPYHGNPVVVSGSLQLQPLANHNMISYPRNYISQNACEESQQLPPDHNLISNRNHVALDASPELQQLLQNQNLESSPDSDHHMIFSSIDHIAVNASPESQQLLQNQNLESSPDSHPLVNCDMIFSSPDHIAVNASPEWQQLLPNQNLELPNFELVQLRNQSLDFGFMNIITENTFDTQPLLLEEFNAGRSYSGLNNASSSTLQSPVYSGQGSSYSNCSNSGGDSLNSQFGRGQVNYPISSQREFQNEYSGQETGGTPIPHFNSSKPDRGVYVTDVNDMDIEAWVNELFEDDICDNGY
ncbi:NAC domain containing protein [Melia azedarach]|uniref:NAC domain containing protein n=1 Tax=Melia azedarach TaxID=155640 RepID=A0ACC1XMS8_MELAZ|nr:NAC domain containing protein [Melia azedarach]